MVAGTNREYLRWERPWGGVFLFLWRDGKAFCLADGGYGKKRFYVAYTSREPGNELEFNRLDWMPTGDEGPQADGRWCAEVVK